ncbi:MAG: CPBP family glutamic-type intramembrane protease [Patescibacteria group bacterium]|jgi:membrane protease YdiL (CAAX protease family)
MDGSRQVLSWRRMALDLLAAYGANWIWVMVVFCLLGAVAGQSLLPYSLPYFSASFWLLVRFCGDDFLVGRPSLVLFFVLFCAPIVEEALFRMLPLEIVRNKRPEAAGVVVIIVCGVLFGLAQAVPQGMLIQGVGGMILGGLYLRNSQNQFAAYFSCVFVHALCNFTVAMTAGII